MTEIMVHESIEDMLTSDEYVVKVADQEIKGPKKWLVFILGPNHKAQNIKHLVDEFKHELSR